MILHRRRFTGGLALGAVTANYLDFSSRAAAVEELADLNRFPRVMQNFLVDRVREANARSVAAKEMLETQEDAERYVQSVRERIAACFGPHPEKTDLNARVTGEVERDAYRIENVIFESRPGFAVTANLYLPKSQSKVPGVIGTCGHSTNGKAAEAYQSFAQGLARLGYACLIYDPIGQGERLQYPDEQLKSKYSPGVQEHIQAGNQQFLVGEFLGMWRAWDGIRALDYLLTRPEIDTQHLGVTGNSGGGTMTTWLCGVEQRWTMAAPACFVTTFQRNAENELPADTEQCPPRALALGLEHEDFLLALAPKPIIILAKERDFFDVRGSEEAFARLQKVYKLLGKPDNIALHIGPTEHGYTIENREAMYRWFNQVTGASDATREPKLVIEDDETLWCTKSGQIAEEKVPTVFDFTRERAQQLQKTRPALRGEELVAAVRDVLKLPELPQLPPHARILRDMGSRGYQRRFATTYAIETEPQVQAISYLLNDSRLLSRPPRGGNQAVLYISHRTSDRELREEPWVRELVSQAGDKPLFTCDVRGIGESLPNTCGNETFDQPYGCDYFYAIHGLMLDRPYLGQKTFDVLRVLQWMAHYGYDQVELVGNGWGALSATFAALLGTTVRSLAVHNMLESFHSLAVTKDYEMPLAYLLPNVLSRFDLPDCLQAILAKNVQVRRIG